MVSEEADKKGYRRVDPSGDLCDKGGLRSECAALKQMAEELAGTFSPRLATEPESQMTTRFNSSTGLPDTQSECAALREELEKQRQQTEKASKRLGQSEEHVKVLHVQLASKEAAFEDLRKELEQLFEGLRNYYEVKLHEVEARHERVLQALRDENAALRKKVEHQQPDQRNSRDDLNTLIATEDCVVSEMRSLMRQLKTTAQIRREQASESNRQSSESKEDSPRWRWARELKEKLEPFEHQRAQELGQGKQSPRKKSPDAWSDPKKQSPQATRHLFEREEDILGSRITYVAPQVRSCVPPKGTGGHAYANNRVNAQVRPRAPDPCIISFPERLEQEQWEWESCSSGGYRG